MHIDCYVQPPAPRPCWDAPKRSRAQNSFVYTGDTFVFSGTPKPPPREVHPPDSFWAWLKSLLG